MSNEWRDLPTMADVAAAQAAGDEIEYLYCGRWVAWGGAAWNVHGEFRARPRTNMKKVKMLCWHAGLQLVWSVEEREVPHTWIRQPHLDLIARVQE